MHSLSDIDKALDMLAECYERTGAGGKVFERLEDERERIVRSGTLKHRIHARLKGKEADANTSNFV